MLLVFEGQCCYVESFSKTKQEDMSEIH